MGRYKQWQRYAPEVFRAPDKDRWAVAWFPHRQDIDIHYDHNGNRFMLRAEVTRENSKHLRGLIDCMDGILALRRPDSPFAWPVLENTWGAP